MKLDKIRLATEEEVLKIAETSDLTPTSRVLAMGDMRAVWRITNELDPLYFGESSDSKKYMFVWGLENLLRGSGANEFYFNIGTENTEFQKIAEHFGATKTSPTPEFRYRINL